MVPRPSTVRWSEHATVKAEFLNVPRALVRDVVLEGHERRARNNGAGDWKVVDRGVAVIYNNPDQPDVTTALVVTLWRPR